MQKKGVLLLAFLALALLAACQPAVQGPEPQPVAPPMPAPPPPPAGTPAAFTGTVLAGASSPLLEYSKSDYDAALQSGRLIVLYFYANWCPICRAEFPLMQSAFGKLTGDNVVGFRVSYKDSETTPDEAALADEYDVTYQHTKVFIKDGKRVLKAPDGWNEARYLAEIDKYRGA